MLTHDRVTTTPSVDRLVSRCQVMAGRIVDGKGIDVLAIHDLANTIPPTATSAERVIIRSVLGSTMARIAFAAGVDDRAEVGRAFVTWTAANAASDTWRADTERLMTTVTSL
jgi:hypothetical protein